jgi:transposase
LHRSGRTPRELASEFQPSEWTIREWIKRADAADGAAAGTPGALLPGSPEREELLRLRKENRRLKLERDILAKAAAWFAQETKTVPPSSDL